MVQKDVRVLMVSRELKVCMDNKEKTAIQVLLGILGHPVHLDPKDTVIDEGHHSVKSPKTIKIQQIIFYKTNTIINIFSDDMG